MKGPRPAPPEFDSVQAALEALDAIKPTLDAVGAFFSRFVALDQVYSAKRTLTPPPAKAENKLSAASMEEPITFAGCILAIVRASGTQPIRPVEIAAEYERLGWEQPIIGEGKNLSDALSSRISQMAKRGDIRKVSNGYIAKEFVQEDLPMKAG